jgi:N-methylhydantoinase B
VPDVFLFTPIFVDGLVRATVRVPEQTIGDFNARFAANGIGVRRVRELCARYGAATVTAAITAAMALLLDYSERRMRAAIAAVPDGVYRGEATLDDDGLGREPLVVRATVTIAGDQVHVDFAGTAGQAPTNINCPSALTIAAALSCVKSVPTSPDIPFNEGSKRPITVTAPYGSLVNPRPPAPVRARMLSGYREWTAVMNALAQVVPERVIAEGFDTTEVVCLSHLGEGGYHKYLEIFGGGYGASAHADGCDAVDSPLSNCGNIPVESMDLDYEFFRVLEYSVRAESGGAGRHRGGMGFCRRYLITRDHVTLATYDDRFVFAPPGICGGQPGERAALLRPPQRRADPDRIEAELCPRQGRRPRDAHRRRRGLRRSRRSAPRPDRARSGPGAARPRDRAPPLRGGRSRLNVLAPSARRALTSRALCAQIGPDRRSIPLCDGPRPRAPQRDIQEGAR